MELKKWTEEQKQLALELSNEIKKNLKIRDEAYKELESSYETEEWAKRTPEALKRWKYLNGVIDLINVNIKLTSSRMPKMDIDFEKIPKNTTLYINYVDGTCEKFLFLKMKNTKRMYHPVFSYGNGNGEMRINNWENASFSIEPLFK